MAKERLDKVMVDRGLVRSRERARALIMAGKVCIGDRKVTKAGTLLDSSADITLKQDDIPFVSRGGVKLAAALDAFSLDPAGSVAMDIGCSTGGFTDCLLQRGASRIYAIDVGYGQLDWSLRNDPRVVLLEKTNIRHLDKERIPGEVDLVVIDVSFISLTQVLPHAAAFLRPDGDVVALIKPQFEVGRDLVDKGGVIRSEEKRLAAVQKISTFAREAGYLIAGFCDSPIPGQKGNREYFIHLRRQHGRT